jgi:two-component system, OmpR family, sensor histidine kinase QseC
MRKLFRPTLARRVLFGLLLAFCVVWVVLIAFQYVEVRIQEGASPGLRQAGAQVADILSSVDDPGEARIIVAAIDRAIRNARQRVHIPGTVLIQLWERNDSHLVFSSWPAAGIKLPPIPGHQSSQVDHEQIYEVVRFDTPRWSVLVAQPRLESDWVLRSLSSDLTKYMLVALPFLVLPMWLAITQGLRPLRQLSERIASRSSEDLTPLGVDPKYAELTPLVTALDSLLAQLHHKIKGEQAFVANAAHELRTPLAVISAQAHVLVKGRTEGERSEAQRPMSAAIARASHLVHQLLVLARLETAHSGAVLTAVDVAHLVREEIGSFVPAAMARNMEISLEGPETLFASLDVHALQSVLQNLVDNAIRYGCDNGRIVVELSLLSLRRDTMILVVSDDGPGIAECDRSLVFDRFYRGQHRDARGAGLGLTIVKQAAARMGGVVQVMSGLDGRGCRFELQIPVQARVTS